MELNLIIPNDQLLQLHGTRTRLTKYWDNYSAPLKESYSSELKIVNHNAANRIPYDHGKLIHLDEQLDNFRNKRISSMHTINKAITEEVNRYLNQFEFVEAGKMDGSIKLDQFITILKGYKKVFETGSGLMVYQSPLAEYIKRQVVRYSA